MRKIISIIIIGSLLLLPSIVFGEIKVIEEKSFIIKTGANASVNIKYTVQILCINGFRCIVVTNWNSGLSSIIQPFNRGTGVGSIQPKRCN